ncbi:MAG: hypothetical protein ACWA44_02505 [Thiotrichales bacterium]
MAPFIFHFRVHGIAVLSYPILIQFEDQQDGTPDLPETVAVGKQLWAMNEIVTLHHRPKPGDQRKEVLEVLTSPHEDFLLADKRGLNVEFLYRQKADGEAVADDGKVSA